MWLILQYAGQRCAEFGWNRIAWHLLLAATLSILLVWPISRMIVRKRGTLVTSALFVGSIIALSAAFLSLGYFIIRAESVTLLAALGVVFACIVFAQTRHLFGASRRAAAGLLGCFAILLASASYASELLTGSMPWSEFAFKSREQQSKEFCTWADAQQATPSPTTTVATTATRPVALAPSAPAPKAESAPASALAPAPAPSPAPRKHGPDLDELYTQLQKARAELDLRDAAAVARFNVQAEAYNQEKRWQQR